MIWACHVITYQLEVEEDYNVVLFLVGPGPLYVELMDQFNQEATRTSVHVLHIFLFVCHCMRYFAVRLIHLLTRGSGPTNNYSSFTTNPSWDMVSPATWRVADREHMWRVDLVPVTHPIVWHNCVQLGRASELLWFAFRRTSDRATKNGYCKRYGNLDIGKLLFWLIFFFLVIWKEKNSDAFLWKTY